MDEDIQVANHQVLLSEFAKKLEEKRIKVPMKKTDDYAAPSYSLGLTQEFAEEPHLIEDKEGSLDGQPNMSGLTPEDKIGGEEKGAINEEENKIRKNPKRTKMVSSSIKSPFLKRETTIDHLFTKEEDAIWDLIFKADPCDQVFDMQFGVRTEFFILRTLEPGRELYGNIIDCWAAVLNNEEKLRSLESPHRLFVCHQPFMEWLFINEEKCLRTFTNNIFQALGRDESQRNLKRYDLVFFPILEKKHFYLVVFDLKNPSTFVIDNMQANESVVQLVDHDEYQKKDTPYKVKHIFNQYLIKWENGKAGRMGSTRINRLELEWATKRNYTDCGIFTVRHMEMFMGKNGANFDCGFKNNERTLKNQIKNLRKKYAAIIVLSDINVHKKKMMDAANILKS